MKKLVVLLLLLSMTLAMFAACQNDGPPIDENTREQETGEEDIPLPEAKAEWKDREFNIIYRDSYDYEWVFEEALAGSVINDAIFDRNSAVEERYDIIINAIPTPNTSFDTDFLQPIRNSIQAGDDDYQLAAGYEYRLASNSAYGDFLNWYQIPYVELTADWWDGNFAEAATYNGSTYIMTGSLSLSHMYTSSCVFFNQDMINARLEGGSAEIYQKVWDGTWTIDAFYEYVQQFTTDNGDDVWNELDTYGYATNVNNPIDSFIFCSEIALSQKNADGSIKLLAPSEQLINLTNKLHNIVNMSGHTYIQEYGNAAGIDHHIGMISLGRAAFTTSYLKMAATLRDTEIMYGILPYPKWDEAQTQYHSITMDSSTAFAVPRVVEDPEFVGAILESLAYYSHVYVRDALYESVLKYRDAKDVDSSKCVDLILENPLYDLAYVYAFEWGDQQGPSALLRTCIKSKQPYIANAFKSNESRFNTTLEKFLKNFK